MKIRQRQETKGKGRGRAKKKVSSAKTAVPDESAGNIIVIDTSSSEEPMPCVVALLDSTDESTDRLVNNSRAVDKMKQVCIKLPDLANVPGALSSKQLDYLAARRLKAKKEAERRERKRIKKQEQRRKIKEELIMKAISISSDSIDGRALTLDQKVTPKRLKPESKKSKKRPREADKKVVESVTLLGFGEKAPSETSVWRINNKNHFNEKTISVCGSSNESVARAATTTTTTTTTTAVKKAAKKRKRCDSELEAHPFTADLEELGRRQRKRNSTKRKKSVPRGKQGVGQGFVNGNSGVSEESSVDRVDFPKALRNDVQGDKLTDAVGDSTRTESIAPVDESVASGKTGITSHNENIASGRASVVPVNDSIESGRASIAGGKESMLAGKESIAAGKESIAADRSVADNDSAAKKEDKVSAINHEYKTSAITDEGKTVAIDDEGKSFDHAPMINGDLTNEVLNCDTFLDCDTDVRMTRMVTNENEHLTLFAASDNDADHALDKEPCSLASIVAAIDNDLAGGNQPIGLPIGGIDSTEIMSLLPDPSMSSNEVNQSKDVEPRLDSSARSHESFISPPANGEFAPILDNGNGSLESNANRKLPVIIEDNIFSESSIGLNVEKIRANRKRKKKLSQTTVSTPSSSVDDNRNFADSIEITLTRNGNLSDAINELGLGVLDKNSGNNVSCASAKDGQFSEDALNNNRETTVMNKNEINSEKQENNKIDCSARPATSQVEEGSCKEFNALKCLLDMGPEALAKAIADGEAGSDLGSLDGQHIDDAIEQFENSIVINNSKPRFLKDALNGEAKPIVTLTVQNLSKFNSRVGFVETESMPTSLRRRETVDTDALSHRTDNTNDSSSTRKRKWISPNGEKTASSASKSCTIKLNRNYPGGSQASTEKCREVEQPTDRGLEPEAPLLKVARIEDKNNYTKNPVITENVSMTNDTSRMILSPIENTQRCVNEIGAFVPNFGDSSPCNLATSTPTKNDVAPVVDSGNNESLGSSSSSSSSDSSTSSSSDSSSSSSSSSSDVSSDESDDEDISRNVENVEGPEVASTKNVEAPCKSDSGTKSSAKTTRQTVEENTFLALFGTEPEPVTTEISAGGLVDDCGDPEKSDDDKSDCISLYTESLCMSRPGSPERQMSLRCSALTVSPQKQQKRGNVRSRLGPHVQTQPSAATASTESSKHTERGPPTATSNIVECVPGANDEVAVEPAPSKARDRLVAANVIQTCPEAAAPVVPDLTAVNRTERRQIEILFRGQCFLWLKQGLCRNAQCWYQHKVLPALQHQLFGTTNTRPIILHAISHRYLYFINLVFQPLMVTMPVRQIIQVGIDLCTSRILTNQHFGIMIEALKVRQLTLVEVADLFDSMMSKSEVQSAMLIIELFCTLLEPGSYWKTLKKLMTKFAETNLPIIAVNAVLDECVKLHSNKLHIDDVHDNLIVNLTDATRLAIRLDLLKSFHDLRQATVADKTNGLPVEATKKSNWTCSIASPDSVRESVDFPLAAQLADRPSPTPVVQPQIARETSKPSSVSQSEEASTSGCDSYTIKHLDKLGPPKSAYNLWKFHLDLQGVQQGLLHNDYDHVIKILTALQQDPNRLPHIAGFYNILCKEIMSSRHHLEEIVRRTVQSGATDELRRFVYDLGVCVLTTLADTGTWVLAYQLLKTFKVYGQYNTCAFTLLSAEIYIANHRPLKALAILKQSRLVFTNTRRWNQMWCPNDEPLRVSVMELLLSSLCDGYAEHALSLLDFILGDQCSSVKPINISRYIDRVAAVLLKEDLPNAVVDLGRLIVKNNLLVSSRTFRALINRIIHSDQFLAKQLHRYATWLGTYNMPKISGITHMIVNVDWTEEEMYLMFSSLLHDLYINIGHAIGRLRPRQLAVYLILEQLPTERQLLLDVSGPPLTNAEIRKRRAVVKSVFERFDPKIKVIQRLQGKLCKIQSESLVNYLKAGHFKC